MASGPRGAERGAGGKIRARLGHQGPGKPYGRGGAQRPGILGGILDSLANIVPGWLQRCFDRKEGGCSCSADVSEGPQRPENRGDREMHRAEGADPDVGQIAPEPAGGDAAEPPAARAGAGGPDVPGRPPRPGSCPRLSGAVSRAPRGQPSPSGAGAAAGAGVSPARRADVLQHKDNDSSAARGVPAARDHSAASPKTASSPSLWSHSLPVSQHTVACSTKPAFNVLAFGTLSPSLRNPSGRAGRLGDSPFYGGQTRRGGAAAAVGPPNPRRAPREPRIVRQGEPKPGHAWACGVASSAAVRILLSLGKTPSPPEDRKPRPSVESSLNSSLHRSGKAFQTKGRRADPRHPPVQRLMVPKPVSIATHQTSTLKPSLTPSDKFRKPHQRMDKKDSPVYEKTVITRPNREGSSFSHRSLRIPAASGLSPGEDGGRGETAGQRTHYIAPTPAEEEEMTAAMLWKIPPPIATSMSPNFNFTSPEITDTTSPIASSESLRIKTQMTSLQTAADPELRFSFPLLVSTEAGELPPRSAPSTLSVPVENPDVSGCSSVSSSTQEIAVGDSGNSQMQHEDRECLARPAKIWEQDRDLDVTNRSDYTTAQPTMAVSGVYKSLSTNTFSSRAVGSEETLKAGSSWKDGAHLLEDQVTDCEYIASQEAQLPSGDTAEHSRIGPPNQSGRAALPAAETGFGNKFGPCVGTWDDFVQNKPTAMQSVARETWKPETGATGGLTSAVISECTVTPASASICAVTSETGGSGGKCTRPVGSRLCASCCASNNAGDKKCSPCMCEKPGSSVPASNSSTVPDCLSARGCPGLDKSKRPPGSWDGEADSTKSVACESAKPHTKFEVKGFGTLSSSWSPAASFFSYHIPSSSPGPSQTLTNTDTFHIRNQKGLSIAKSTDSGKTKALDEGFDFADPTGEFKFEVPPDSNIENLTAHDKNDKSFRFWLSPGLSSEASLAPFQFSVSNFGQQIKREKVPRGSPDGFGFRVEVSDPVAATDTHTVVTSGRKSSSSFGCLEAESISVAPFTCKTTEVNTETMPVTKAGVSFSSRETAPVSSASKFALGRTEENQPEPGPFTSPVLGKRADNEVPKCPPGLSFGNPERSTDESSSKATFTFDLAKLCVKGYVQPAKATFAFGAQAKSPSDKGGTKPAFSSLRRSPSMATTPATSGCGGVFGSASTSSSQPVASFMLRCSDPLSRPASGDSAKSCKSRSLLFAQDSKPVTPSMYR